MSLKNFQRSLEKLEKAIELVISKGIEISTEKRNIADFKDQKTEFIMSELSASLKGVIGFKWDYDAFDQRDREGIDRINTLIGHLNEYIEKKELASVKDSIDKLKYESTGLRENKAEGGMDIKIKPMPPEISEEINSDVNEIKKCYDCGAYRSTTILCGKILETALHRKYFELTNNDLLETAPGLGLGKMVAKLAELDVNFGPGINEQIHLINKVRVSSVHKKANVFNPSKEQAHAMILYTTDIINRFF